MEPTEPPVDFLVKHLLSSDQSFFCSQLLQDYAFVGLCELQSGLTDAEGEVLALTMLRFYDSYHVLDKVFRGILAR